MRKKNKKLQGKYLILLIILVTMILLTIYSFTLKDDRKLNKIESLIKDTVLSIENVVFTPFRYITNIFSDYGNLKKVQEENDTLKSNIYKIEAVEAENEELRREIEALKSELDINYVLTDYENLNATVISRNITYWYNTITIDKGSYNGIENEMVVVNSSGLLGKVINTTTFTSTVKLITTSDTSNKVSVTIYTSEGYTNGLISSYDYKTNALEVEGISNTEIVNVGDTVYTSGLGGIFPSGILIGKVDSITTDEYDLSKIIKVIPSANFDSINYVTVLKRKTDNK